MSFNIGDKVNIKESPHKNLTISRIDGFGGMDRVQFEGKDFFENIENLEHVKKAPVPEAPQIRTEYILVSRRSIRDFNDDCQTLLNEGWTPVGGVSVCYIPNSEDSFLNSQSFAISREINQHLPEETK